MAKDKQGWERVQNERGYSANGNMKASKMAFFRMTTNPEVSIWVSPAKTVEGYVVEKAKNLGNYEIETTNIATFSTAVEAKEWVNTEYAHLLK